MKIVNELSVRIYAINLLNHRDKRYNEFKNDDKWLKTGALKGFMDGPLGSHTAVFVKDYSDKPEDKGFYK